MAGCAASSPADATAPNIPPTSQPSTSTKTSPREAPVLGLPSATASPKGAAGGAPPVRPVASSRPPPATSTAVPAKPPATTSPPQPTAKSPAQWAGGFVAYPGARQLCWQTITGTSGRIRFTAYVTAALPAKVGKFYQPNDSGGGGSSSGSSNTDAVVELERAGGYILSVYPRTGRYPSCGRFLSAKDQTVIIVSQMVN